MPESDTPKRTAPGYKKRKSSASKKPSTPKDLARQAGAPKTPLIDPKTGRLHESAYMAPPVERSAEEKLLARIKDYQYQVYNRVKKLEHDLEDIGQLDEKLNLMIADSVSSVAPDIDTKRAYFEQLEALTETRSQKGRFSHFLKSLDMSDAILVISSGVFFTALYTQIISLGWISISLIAFGALLLAVTLYDRIKSSAPTTNDIDIALNRMRLAMAELDEEAQAFEATLKK